jgi:thiol:disulfide interchange protein DsbD
VKNAIGVLLLGLAIGLLSRVMPGQVTLLLIGLLAGGVGLFLGALEFVSNRLANAWRNCSACFCWFTRWPAGMARSADRPIRSTRSVRRARLPATRQRPTAMHGRPSAPRPTSTAHWPKPGAGHCAAAGLVRRLVHQLQSHRARSAQRPTVVERLKGYRLMRFDITASNAEQRALLDRYKLFGLRH